MAVAACVVSEPMYDGDDGRIGLEDVACPVSVTDCSIATTLQAELRALPRREPTYVEFLVPVSGGDRDDSCDDTFYCKPCPGCSDSRTDHDPTCRVVGRRCRLRFSNAEYFEQDVADGNNFTPTPKMRSRTFDLGEGSSQKLCKFDRGYDAYRRALELVDLFGYDKPERGYPVWWRSKKQVLAYLPRTDGRDQLDQEDLSFAGERVYHTVLTREEAISRFKDDWSSFYHVGKRIPSPQELGVSPNPEEAGGISLPGRLAVSARKVGKERKRHARMNLIHGYASAMVCDEDDRLWIMDTGCGNDLVPERVVDRTTARIIPNTSSKKLHTANGVVTAPDRVAFRLEELNNQTCKAIVLNHTPHVLSMGFRCVSLGYDFIWKGSKGETPYFVDDRGKRHDCEVHGYIPYFRTSEPAMPGPGEVSEADLADSDAGSGDADHDMVQDSDGEDEDLVEEGEPQEANLEGVPPEDVVEKGPTGTRDLKAEAASLRHLMTHTPKNPWCPVCQSAKMQRKPCKRKVKIPKLDKNTNHPFCEQVTADHVVANSERSMGVTGAKDALIIGCRGTRYFDGLPTSSKNARDTTWAINQFKGTTTIKELYSDNSGEIGKAADWLGIPHPTSTPHKPQTNGCAERLVRKVMEGTRCALPRQAFPQDTGRTLSVLIA